MLAAADWNAYEALSAYTKAIIGLSADELLLRGCLDGRLPSRFTAFARLETAGVRSRPQADGGELLSYEGRLEVQGVLFRFACDIRYDAVREIYAVAGLAVEPAEWTVGLRVPPPV